MRSDSFNISADVPHETGAIWRESTRQGPVTVELSQVGSAVRHE
jgi:hypothetical protein